MSTFYASKVEKVAAAGEAHNAAIRKRYPHYEDQLRALNLNIRLALVGDAQVFSDSIETNIETNTATDYFPLALVIAAHGLQLFLALLCVSIPCPVLVLYATYM